MGAKIGNKPFAKRGKSTPKHDGKSNHEKGMRAKVGGNGEITIKGGSAQPGLKPGQVRCLPSD